MVKKVICKIVVEVDEEVMEERGYDTIEDYLNECKFCVYNDDDDDICIEVREYESINS